MSNSALLVWFLNVVADTAGHVALKYAAMTTHDNEWQRWQRMLSSFPLWIGIACFCLEFALWLILLSLLSLSLGVLLGAFNMVSIVIAGRIFFRETLSLPRLLGAGLITLGVVLIGIYA